jgi:hypothetical protein
VGGIDHKKKKESTERAVLDMLKTEDTIIVGDMNSVIRVEHRTGKTTGRQFAKVLERKGWYPASALGLPRKTWSYISSTSAGMTGSLIDHIFTSFRKGGEFKMVENMVTNSNHKVIVGSWRARKLLNM